MKLIKSLLAVLLFLPLLANAQPYTAQQEQDRLINFGMTSELAVELTDYINGDGVLSILLPNNVYLKARNAAGTADLDLLKADATDDTVLNADTGDIIKLAIAGTTEITLGTADLSPVAVAGNALGTAALPWSQLVQGAVAIDADVTANTGPAGLFNAKNNSTDADNAALIGFGNTAVGPNFKGFKTRATTTNANTIVQSGDGILSITGYGADGDSYRNAASIRMTVSGTPGSSDMPGKIDFLTTPDGSATLASVLSLDQDKAAQFTGTVRSSATADIGWSLVAGANTACNTTCTSACVIGQDTATFALVGCATATADQCLCAGAS